jgi:hypothetical protein
MHSLHEAIEATAAAARNVATDEHIKSICQHLQKSTKVFPLKKGHQFTDLSTKSGLYLFEIKFPFKTELEFSEFLMRWGSKGDKGLQKATSRAHPSRAAKHIEKVKGGEFIPLYLGKNQNVQTRVQQHLDGKAESGTYGLKLLTRSELLAGCELQVSYVTFDIGSDAYFCVEFLESAVRKAIHPIIGKQ